MGEDGQIPAGAQGMAIFVIVYTCINAFASTVVFSMHVYHGDVFGCMANLILRIWRGNADFQADVPICAVFMLISIAASFIQQIHHYVNYTSIITASFKWRHGNDRTGKEAFTGTYTEMDTVLYEIRMSLSFICGPICANLVQSCIVIMLSRFYSCCGKLEMFPFLPSYAHQSGSLVFAAMSGVYVSASWTRTKS